MEDQNKENEIDNNILLPEEGEREEKSETQNLVESILNSIEDDLPKNVDYVTGIITDDDRNLLIIKKGKIYVGKTLEDSKPIREYTKDANIPFLINTLYILKGIIPSYKDMWSGKLESETRKKYNEIF